MLSRLYSALYLLYAVPYVVSISLDSIDTIFSFGDSYTSSGYDPSAGVLAIGNTVTTSGGQSWIQLLASQTSARTSYFNLATSNSSIASSVVSGSSGRDFEGQVEQFRAYFNESEAQVEWDSDTTMFTVWFGADDVLNTFLGSQDFVALAPSVLTAYDAQISALYSLGARSFLLLAIPSLGRSPLATSSNSSSTLQAAVDFFNARIEFYVGMIPTRFPGAEATYFDSKGLMDRVLDNPEGFGLINATQACESYSGVINQPLLNLSSACGGALAQYFWRDDWHPTWPIHQLIAEGVASLLGGSSTPSPTAPTPTRSTTSNSSTSTATPAPTGGSSFPLPSFSVSLNSSSTPTRTSTSNSNSTSAPSQAQATTLTGTVILSGSQILFVGGANSSVRSTQTIPLPSISSNSTEETSSPYFTPSSSISSSAETEPTPAPTPSSTTTEEDEGRQRTTTTAGRVRVGTNTSAAAGGLRTPGKLGLVVLVGAAGWALLFGWEGVLQCVC